MSVVMAKKKSKRIERPIREMAVGIRATEDWKVWLDEFAEFKRTTIVDLIDRALEESAQKSGFRPPPRR